MLKRVRIRGYRCFRDVDIELKPLQILVGPNGSGKSAFLDAIRFVEDIVRNGLHRAIARRVWKPEELFWKGTEKHIEISLTWQIPNGQEDEGGWIDEVTYNIVLERKLDHVEVASERLTCLGDEIWVRTGETGWIRGDRISLTMLGSNASLSWLFDWELLGRDLKEWVNKAWPEFMRPNPFAIRMGAAPWRQPRHHRVYPNARNLALVMRRFQEEHPEAYERWLEEMRVLAKETIDFVVHRDEVTHLHRIAMRWNGLWVSPSGITDGWLRFMALSLPAYDPENEGRIFFIEEIENGLSPDAIEMLFRIMEETPSIQWLATSHHALLVRLAGPERLLVFHREGEEVRVTPGDQHPLLRDMKPDADLAALFLARILS
ncbi:MAG: AAA family ATPase [Anaerolineae bacterium]|nr:AAA family ATPase [Thermoflexus sp.]MDW8181394.1 AAA family ATPase [Anaerolineae bacterium]